MFEYLCTVVQLSITTGRLKSRQQSWTHTSKKRSLTRTEATKAELKLSAFVQKKAFNDNNTAKAVWEQQKHL